MIEISNVKPLADGEKKSSAKVVSSADQIKECYFSYLCDESRITTGQAEEIVFPESELELSEWLIHSHKSKKPVTISGGRTGIVGGAVPHGGSLISMERIKGMRKVRWDPANKHWLLRVLPALSLDELQHDLDNRNEKDRIKTDRTEEQIKFWSESDAWFYPPDPTEKTAHIGGTAATDASGARSFKYGSTRKHIKSLRFMTGDGSVFEIERGNVIFAADDVIVLKGHHQKFSIAAPSFKSPKIKNTAGYFARFPLDLIDLIIGSEGTLGIITEVELSLRRKPEMNFSAVSYFNSEKQAFAFVDKIKNQPHSAGHTMKPASIEYFGPNTISLYRKKINQFSIPNNVKTAVFFEHETESKNLDRIYRHYDSLLNTCGSSIDMTWGALDEAEYQKMVKFRHALPETINGMISQRKQKNSNLHKISTDFVLPERYFNEMYAYYRQILDNEGLEYYIFGHIGENHVHVNILPNSEDEIILAKSCYQNLAKKAVSLGGTICGEHGIGKLKKGLLQLMYSPSEIEAMRKLKLAFDPQNSLGVETMF